MTGKSRLKFGIFVITLIVAIPVSLIGLTLLFQFVSYFQQGANPASIFRGHTLVVPDETEVQWQILPDYSGEVPTLSEQEEIMAAYWLGWEALRRAQETGDTSDIATYWAGAAYEHAMRDIDAEQPLFSAHSGHTLILSFFSDDGSVVSFEDNAFTLVHGTDDNPIDLTVSAEIVMTLDQGFWRIRSLLLRYQ